MKTVELYTHSSMSERGFTLSLCCGDRAVLEVVSEDLAGLNAVDLGGFFGAQTYGVHDPYWDEGGFDGSVLESRLLSGFVSDMDCPRDLGFIYRAFALLMCRVGFPCEATQLYISRVSTPDGSDSTGGYCLHGSVDFYQENFGRTLNIPEDLLYFPDGVGEYLLKHLVGSFGVSVDSDDRQEFIGAVVYCSMLLKAYYADAECLRLWTIDTSGVFDSVLVDVLCSEPDEVKRGRLARARRMVDWVMDFNADAAYVLAADCYTTKSERCETLQEFAYHFRTTTPEIAMPMYEGAFSSVGVTDCGEALLRYATDSRGAAHG